MADEQDATLYANRLAAAITGSEYLLAAASDTLGADGLNIPITAFVLNGKAGNFSIGTRGATYLFNVGSGFDGVVGIVSGITKAARFNTDAASMRIEGVSADGTTFQPLNLGGSYVVFSASGSEVARLSGGNLGIGVAAPTYRIQTPTTGTAEALLGGIAIGQNGTDIASTIGQLNLKSAAGESLVFSPGGAPRFSLATTGHFRLINDQAAMRIDSTGFGGSIRLRGNSAAATDRGVQLGRVDNSGNYLGFWEVFSDTGTLGPIGDGGANLGSAALRVSVVYAVTGTINTSDEREKSWLQSGLIGSDDNRISDKIDDEAFYRAGLEILDELGFYQWLDAIESKGTEKGEDGARIHFGARAQRVFSALENHGIDPARIAFCCFDEWPDQFEPIYKTVKKTEKQEVPNPKFNPEKKVSARNKETKIVSVKVDEQVDTGKKKLVRKAGNRYGLRPDMLNSFLIIVSTLRNDRRQDELEARLQKIERALDQ